MTARANRKQNARGNSAEQGDDPLSLAKVMPHHRAAWRVERIGWAVMALLLLSAMLGAFGGGPLNKVRASRGGLSVEYHRLQRASAETEYRIEADASLVRDGRLRLRLAQALVDDMDLEAIIPEPDAVIAGKDHTEFVFLAAPGNGQSRVTFRVRPATFGRRAGRIDTPGAPPLEVDQFIYP